MIHTHTHTHARVSAHACTPMPTIYQVRIILFAWIKSRDEFMQAVFLSGVNNHMESNMYNYGSKQHMILKKKQ